MSHKHSEDEEWRIENTSSLLHAKPHKEKRAFLYIRPPGFADIRWSLASVLTLRSGNSALHFYVCELRNTLCALGDGRDDMLESKKHGEEQDEKNGQEAQKQAYIHVQVGILVWSGVNLCCQSGKMSPPREISMILKMHLRHHSRFELLFASIWFLLPLRHFTVTWPDCECFGGVSPMWYRPKSVAHKQEGSE